MTFRFLERFVSLSPPFLRMLMISWVTAGPFRSVSLSLFISPLEFLSPICIFAPWKNEQYFGFFCNWSIVHHSPGLHAKMKRQIKSIKAANPQEMARCITYTTSSTYRFDKPNQWQSTGNSSATQNTDVRRVDQSAGGKTLNRKLER